MKKEGLTFVACGNRSQAKEEEGEKMHSVHLREERYRGGGKRWGEGQGGGREGHTVHASITDRCWKKSGRGLEERHKHSMYIK